MQSCFYYSGVNYINWINCINWLIAQQQVTCLATGNIFSVIRQASSESLFMDNSVSDIAQVKTKKLNPLYLIKIVRNWHFLLFFQAVNLASCKASEKIKLVKYINWRLLNYTKRFASNVNYLLFCQKILQLKSLQEKISIAMRKHSSFLNASMF